MMKNLLAAAGLAVVVGAGSFVPLSAQAASTRSALTGIEDLNPCQIDVYYNCLLKTGDQGSCIIVARNALDCPPE